MMKGLVFFLLMASEILLVTNASTHNSFPHPEIQPILQKLAMNQVQPTLWRRLGKLQLDAGEFAEARRIFCKGSGCCPIDDQLKHHVRVFEAFHKSSQGCETTQQLPPLAKAFAPATNQNDLFLSLDVPSKDIPQCILQHPSSSIPSHLRTRLIHATKEAIIPKNACRYLIQEAITATKQIGWTKDRHVQAPTCDVPVFNLPPSTQQWVKSAFDDVLFPLLCKAVAPELQIEPSDLRVQDCFIVRYDASNDDPGFSSLKPHQDESLLSLTIALNDNDEYEEGGLYIASTQDILDGPAGTVLCFAGGLVHGGYPVTKGTRWILTVFLYVDKNQSGKTPGYTLEALEKMKKSV